MVLPFEIMLRLQRGVALRHVYLHISFVATVRFYYATLIHLGYRRMLSPAIRSLVGQYPHTRQTCLLHSAITNSTVFSTVRMGVFRQSAFGLAHSFLVAWKSKHHAHTRPMCLATVVTQSHRRVPQQKWELSADDRGMQYCRGWCQLNTVFSSRELDEQDLTMGGVHPLCPFESNDVEVHGSFTVEAYGNCLKHCVALLTHLSACAVCLTHSAPIH